MSLDLDDRADARTLIRDGAIAVIVVESYPYWYPDNASTEPNHYEDHVLDVVRPGETPADVAARRGGTRWRIVATADPADHDPGWRLVPRSRDTRDASHA